MSSTMSSPVPAHLVADGLVSAACAVAHDAILEGRAGALGLLVGQPATIAIVSDRYAADVVRATAKTMTLRYRNSGRELTFRQNSGGSWVNGWHYASVGQAVQKWDEGF
jgi:hypothetical protein